MTLISGASGFLNAATLSNTRGRAPSSPNLLGQNSVDLLEVGRRFRPKGIGLSPSARALNKQFLNQTSGLYNTLLSLPAEANSTANLQTKILALRAQLPVSQLSNSVINGGDPSGESDSVEDNPFLEVSRGDNLDTTA